MNLLLAVLVLTVPVLLVVLLALAFGRRLSGSCGGLDADGRCSRCGRPAAEIPKLRDPSEPCS